jgi:hypothetical protein
MKQLNSLLAVLVLLGPSLSSAAISYKYTGHNFLPTEDLSGNDGVPDLFMDRTKVDIGIGVQTSYGEIMLVNGATGGKIVVNLGRVARQGGSYGNFFRVSDFNGDNVPDVGYSRGGFENGAGRLFVLNARTGAVLRTYAPPEGTSGFFGAYAIQTTMDFDGDGFGEFLVGSPEASNGLGAVSLIRSSTGTARWINSGDINGSQWGSFITPVRDFNGDGLVDYLVSAPHAASQNAAGQNSKGYYSVVSGLDGREFLRSQNPIGGSPTWPSVWHAWSTGATMRDYNGDGVSDYFVAHPSNPNAQDQEFLFIHSGANHQEICRVRSPVAGPIGFSSSFANYNGLFGFTFGLPDNANGRDLVVSAPDVNKVYVLRELQRCSYAVVYTYTGPANSWAGNKVSKHDFNRDGTSDIYVSQVTDGDGSLVVLSGKNGGVLKTYR